MKFLIIDDDVDYRKLTIRHLQKEFHDTVLVESPITRNSMRRWNGGTLMRLLPTWTIHGSAAPRSAGTSEIVTRICR